MRFIDITTMSTHVADILDQYCTLYNVDTCNGYLYIVNTRKRAHVIGGMQTVQLTRQNTDVFLKSYSPRVHRAKQALMTVYSIHILVIS